MENKDNYDHKKVALKEVQEVLNAEKQAEKLIAHAEKEAEKLIADAKHKVSQKKTTEKEKINTQLDKELKEKNKLLEKEQQNIVEQATSQVNELQKKIKQNSARTEKLIFEKVLSAGDS